MQRLLLHNNKPINLIISLHCCINEAINKTLQQNARHSFFERTPRARERQNRFVFKNLHVLERARATTTACTRSVGSFIKAQEPVAMPVVRQSCLIQFMSFRVSSESCAHVRFGVSSIIWSNQGLLLCCTRRRGLRLFAIA